MNPLAAASEACRLANVTENKRNEAYVASFSMDFQRYLADNHYANWLIYELNWEECQNETFKLYDAWRESQRIKTRKWAFTLTTNRPASESEKSEQELINAVTKLFTQQTQPIVEGSAYLEYTEAGVPHIHGWYHIGGGGRLYAKQFKRAWPLWDESKKLGKGHMGGYHAQMKDDRYEAYASVEGRKIISIPEV